MRIVRKAPEQPRKFRLSELTPGQVYSIGPNDARYMAYERAEQIGVVHLGNGMAYESPDATLGAVYVHVPDAELHV